MNKYKRLYELLPCVQEGDTLSPMAVTNDKIKLNNEEYWFMTNEGFTSNKVTLSPKLLNTLYKIEPRYLDFEEAMEYLRDDKDVLMFRNNEYFDTLSYSKVPNCSFSMLLNAKYLVKEEN